jgi:hypothetical protein
VAILDVGDMKPQNAAMSASSAPEEVRDFLKKKSNAYCDDCIAEVLTKKRLERGSRDRIASLPR